MLRYKCATFRKRQVRFTKYFFRAGLKKKLLRLPLLKIDTKKIITILI